MSGTITDISPAYIEPSPDNPRRDVGDVTELAASIASVGVIEPLVVRPLGKKAGHDRYQVIVGHRRLAAAQVAGSMWVPCIVREYAEEARAEIMLIENLQRVDLAPLEEAAAFQRLVDEFSWSQEKLAQRIGRSQSHISKRLALLQLPAKVHKALDSGGITIGDALELTKLAAYPERLQSAFEHGKQWGGVERAVENELNDQKRHDRFESAVARAVKGKAAYRQAGGSGSSLPAKSKRLRGRWEGDSEGLDLTDARAKEHEGEDCHAVTVLRTYDGGELVAVCTKPERHVKDMPKLRATASRAEAAQRERDQALKAAAKVRRAFVREQLMASRVSGETVEIVAARELVRASWSQVVKGACEYLDLEPVIEKRPYGDTKSYAEPLYRMIDAGPTPRRKVMFALAIASSEESIRHAYHAWSVWSVRDHDYFALLQEHGYEPTDAEQAELAKAPEASDEESDGEEIVQCRVCGCTDDDACEGGCSWVDDPEQLGNLCSRCRDERYAAGELQEAAAE